MFISGSGALNGAPGIVVGATATTEATVLGGFNFEFASDLLSLQHVNISKLIDIIIFFIYLKY